MNGTKLVNKIILSREIEENCVLLACQSAVPAIFRKYWEIVSKIFMYKKNKTDKNRGKR